MSKGKSSFVIRIGKFDDRLGPICLNAQAYKDVFCEFGGEICKDITTRAIIDALGVDKESFSFEEDIYIFQAINVKIPNPLARGKKEKYSIIIKFAKGKGKVRAQFTERIRLDFLKKFEDLELSPTLDDIADFCNKWEKIMNESSDVTDIAAKVNEMRKKPFKQFPPASREQTVSFMVLTGILIALGVGFVFTNLFNGGFGDGWSIAATIPLIGLIAVVFAAVFYKNRNG